MDIRKANLGDAQKITEIAQVLYLDIPGFNWHQEDFIMKQIEKGEYYVAVSSDSAFVATSAKEVALAQEEQVAGVMSLRERNGMLYIETLAVAKDIQAPHLRASGGQAKGVGSGLVEFAKQFAKENNFKILRTTSFYEYGVKDFYLKNGFRLLDEPGEYNGHKFHRLEFEV